jgi:hypothetical protein
MSNPGIPAGLVPLVIFVILICVGVWAYNRFIAPPIPLQEKNQTIGFLVDGFYEGIPELLEAKELLHSRLSVVHTVVDIRPYDANMDLEDILKKNKTLTCVVYLTFLPTSGDQIQANVDITYRHDYREVGTISRLKNGSPLSQIFVQATCDWLEQRGGLPLPQATS